MSQVTPITVTDELVRELLYESDISNKGHIASLIRAKYEVDGWTYLVSDVLKDLLFCWLAKAYFIGAHEGVRLHDISPERTARLNVLKQMYQDVDYAQKSIDLTYDMGDFANFLSSVNIMNPLVYL